MKILITGGNGYVAKSLSRGLSNKYEITSINRNTFDLTDTKATNNWFNDKYFDVVLHTAITGGSRFKLDDQQVIKNNLDMYYNLKSNKNHFNKFISFGSGAEIYMENAPYGLSKKIIAKDILLNDNFYNIRIFAAFDEHELDSRFIKSNLVRYIKKECMLIHANKVMDFFYMQDLVNLVDHYIAHDDLQKEINCCYDEKYTLVGIAKLINRLDKYNVPIVLQNDSKLDIYSEQTMEFPIKLVGLPKGIELTYNKLLDNL